MIVGITLVFMSLLVLRNTIWINEQIALAEDAREMLERFAERYEERDHDEL